MLFFSSFDLITLPPFPVAYFMPRGLTPNDSISLMGTFEYRGSSRNLFTDMKSTEKSSRTEVAKCHEGKES